MYQNQVCDDRSIILDEYNESAGMYSINLTANGKNISNNMKQFTPVCKTNVSPYHNQTSP